MNSIQTELRNRMVFLCNSICHMLGEDISRWTVFIDDNKDFPSLCGYDIIYYGHDDFIPDFQLTLRKATEKRINSLLSVNLDITEPSRNLFALQSI